MKKSPYVFEPHEAALLENYLNTQSQNGYRLINAPFLIFKKHPDTLYYYVDPVEKDTLTYIGTYRSLPIYAGEHFFNISIRPFTVSTKKLFVETMMLLTAAGFLLLSFLYDRALGLFYYLSEGLGFLVLSALSCLFIKKVMDLLLNYHDLWKIHKNRYTASFHRIRFRCFYHRFFILAFISLIILSSIDILFNQAKPYTDDIRIITPSMLLKKTDDTTLMVHSTATPFLDTHLYYEHEDVRYHYYKTKNTFLGHLLFDLQKKQLFDVSVYSQNDMYIYSFASLIYVCYQDDQMIYINSDTRLDDSHVLALVHDVFANND